MLRRGHASLPGEWQCATQDLMPHFGVLAANRAHIKKKSHIKQCREEVLALHLYSFSLLSSMLGEAGTETNSSACSCYIHTCNIKLH